MIFRTSKAQRIFNGARGFGSAANDLATALARRDSETADMEDLRSTGADDPRMQAMEAAWATRQLELDAAVAAAQQALQVEQLLGPSIPIQASVTGPNGPLILVAQQANVLDIPGLPGATVVSPTLPPTIFPSPVAQAQADVAADAAQVAKTAAADAQAQASLLAMAAQTEADRQAAQAAQLQADEMARAAQAAVDAAQAADDAAQQARWKAAFMAPVSKITPGLDTPPAPTPIGPDAPAPALPADALPLVTGQNTDAVLVPPVPPSPTSPLLLIGVGVGLLFFLRGR